MSNQQISSAYLIAKIHRDYKPTVSGWHVNAIEWVGEALGIMNLQVALVKTQCTIPVTNHKIKLPCSVENLSLVTTGEGCLINPINSSMLVDKAFNLYEGLVGGAIHEGNAHYQINGNYLHFSFLEGNIVLYYDAIPVDKEGYPLIPEDQMVNQALAWYVVRMLCLNGMKHPVVSFEMADARWEVYYPRAQNRVKTMTPEQRSMFSKNWISIIPTLNRRETFYTDLYVRLNGDNNIEDFKGTTIQ